jgi:hypothetical protein
VIFHADLSLFIVKNVLYFICCLFNDTVSSSDYIASNYRIDLERIWKEAVVSFAWRKRGRPRNFYIGSNHLKRHAPSTHYTQRIHISVFIRWITEHTISRT